MLVYEDTEIVPNFGGSANPTEEGNAEIIVTGRRLQQASPFVPSGNNVQYASYTPLMFRSVDLVNGNNGPITAVSVPIVGELEGVTISLPELNLKVVIDSEDWSKFTERQKAVILYVFQNYAQSPDLNKALQHFENEGVTRIEIHIGDKFVGLDGQLFDFPDAQPGNSADAVIIYDSNRGDLSRSDIVGTTVVITFNINEPTNLNLDTFARNLVHELMHPWVPDVLQPDGSYDDHPQLMNKLDEAARGDLYNGGSVYDVPSSDAGVAVLGSYASDHVTGSYNDDLLAGMEGDDYLDGVSGSDVLYGGLGDDVLKVGAGFSEMQGGLGADTYVMETAGANVIQDAGGLDQLRVNGNSYQFFFGRAGDDLILWLDNQYGTYREHVIVGQFGEPGRIETFVFNNGVFSASYIESLAQQEEDAGGDGDGPPHVVPGPIGAPVAPDTSFEKFQADGLITSSGGESMESLLFYRSSEPAFLAPEPAFIG